MMKSILCTVVRKDMDVNENGRAIQHYTQTQVQVKAQLVVRKDMDVNEPGTTIRH